MGSPVSGILAEIVMQDMEEWLTPETSAPPFYLTVIQLT